MPSVQSNAAQRADSNVKDFILRGPPAIAYLRAFASSRSTQDKI
jgi:hypothetical protein